MKKLKTCKDFSMESPLKKLHSRYTISWNSNLKKWDRILTKVSHKYRKIPMTKSQTFSNNFSGYAMKRKLIHQLSLIPRNKCTARLSRNCKINFNLKSSKTPQKIIISKMSGPYWVVKLVGPPNESFPFMNQLPSHNPKLSSVSSRTSLTNILGSPSKKKYCKVLHRLLISNIYYPMSLVRKIRHTKENLWRHFNWISNYNP